MPREWLARLDVTQRAEKSSSSPGAEPVALSRQTANIF